MNEISPAFTNSISSNTTAAKLQMVGVHAQTAKTAASSDISPKLVISEESKALMQLYDAASAYVRQEHMRPFSGYQQGGAYKPGEVAYVNEEKYNNHLFDKAATKLLDQAREIGIKLDKKDIIAQLKSDNFDIANLKFNIQQRRDSLGESSVFSALSFSDIDSLTDAYIMAKENGLDLHQLGGLAGQTGIYRIYGHLMPPNSYDSLYPADWDFDETDPDKIAAAKKQMAPPEDIRNMQDTLRVKLKTINFGLGADFITHLLNHPPLLGGAAKPFLEFLSKLADLQSSEKSAQQTG